MIIFLYGLDTYRSSQKLKEIIDRYKKIHKSGLNLKFFDFQEDSFEDFRDAFRSHSMFDEKKLMVLKNVFSNSNIEKKFEDLIETFFDSKEVILFYEKEIDEKASLFSLFKKRGKIQKFELLKGKKLENWAEKEFQKYSTEIEPSALDLLINYVGDNLWQMANEIKKLVCYKKGTKNFLKKDTAAINFKKITNVGLRDIKTLVRPKIEVDIFETINAIAAKNKKKALSLVKKHLQKGDSASYILAMINFQFRSLLIVKDLIKKGKSQRTISIETTLHPFVVKKNYALANKFEFEELKKIHQKIFETDLNIKTGKLEPETALDLLITEI